MYVDGPGVCQDCYETASTRLRLWRNSYDAWHRFYSPDNDPGFDNAVRCLEGD